MPIWRKERWNVAQGRNDCQTKQSRSRQDSGVSSFGCPTVHWGYRSGCGHESLAIKSFTPLTSNWRANLPLGAKRLYRSSSISEQPNWPHTPEEGLRQSLALSDLGHRHLLERTRIDHQNLSLEAIHKITYQQICAWQQLRLSLRFRPSI